MPLQPLILDKVDNGAVLVDQLPRVMPVPTQLAGLAHQIAEAVRVDNVLDLLPRVRRVLGVGGADDPAVLFVAVDEEVGARLAAEVVGDVDLPPWQRGRRHRVVVEGKMVDLAPV